MNNNLNAHSSVRTPIATGWTVWLTWLFVIVYGFVVVLFIFGITLATLRTQPLGITLWSGLAGLFWIGCIGVLMRSRRLASMAVVLAWVLVILSIIDIIRTAIETGIDFFVRHQQVDPHSLLGTFVIAVMYAYFASDIGMTLRMQTKR